MATAAGGGAGATETVVVEDTAGAGGGAAAAASDESVSYPLKVVYCGVCGLPPEYCEWGPSWPDCKPWLLENCPELVPHLVPKTGGDADDAAAELAEMELGDKKKGHRGGKSHRRRQKKKKIERKENPRVFISVVERKRKKHTTIVMGLEDFPELKMKQAAKKLGKKCSSGSTVVDTPITGGIRKDVNIQGDFSYEMPRFLVELFGLPKKSIFRVEGKKATRAFDSDDDDDDAAAAGDADDSS